MNESIVYEALVYYALPWLRIVHVTLSRAESHLQIGNFICCYVKKLIINNGAKFKFHLPEVFAWSFVLRLEHLAVTFVTIKHSLRFQQEGAIE